MTTTRLSEAPLGELVFTTANMDGGEVRETYYRRREGAARFPHNVLIFSVGCVQGQPQCWFPRVVRIPDAEGYPNEADGRVPVSPLSATVFPFAGGRS
jgi:hypothetical protein